MNDLSNKTLSQIVTDHYQTASVFEKYRLDFCCKGKRSLNDACDERQLPIEEILKELYQVVSTEDQGSAFNQMSLAELAAYITRVHHTYVKLNTPLIYNYILKVVSKHGEKFPYMIEVHQLFAELSEELHEHMAKEETQLFPRIVLLELNAAQNGQTSYLNIPIEILKQEHDNAGALMQRIRELTNNYEAPAEACTTFRLTLESLKAFEEDLHKHVHLENNILFPKAMSSFSQGAPCSVRK